VNALVDGSGFYRRIPSVGVVVTRTDATAADTGSGHSLAARLEARVQGALPAHKALLRVLHAATIDLAIMGGPVLFRGSHLPALGSPVLVDAGTYDLTVQPAAATAAEVTLCGLTLQAGKLYTVCG
jgi:hypothetical protein